MKEKNQKTKGITLIALVITIIVLLILAGVSIAMLTGQNGILTQAQNAKNRTEAAQAEEENRLNEYNNIINNYVNGGTTGGDTTGSTLGTVTGNEESNTTVQDSLGNKVVVPAGFKVYIPEGTNLEDYNVENGIVIEDVSAKDNTTKGSQFVWIPTGTIHRKDKEDVTINLNRYTFASNGVEAAQGNNEIDEYDGEPCQELASSSYGNTTAINIDDFLAKAAPNATGGFYIGRYEARDGVATSARTSSTEDRQVVTKAESFVYNYVTQSQAATLSRNMYTSSSFTSDLINSYAWDTALVFIQSCSDDNRYSQQSSLNSSLSTTGTTNDVKCNIYDMASNCAEWSTETAKNNSIPCVSRGGGYNGSDVLAGTRVGNSYGLGDNGSFRPLLYL